MKILLVAGMEHTKGQDLLAREIAAFGYWTLNFYEQPHIQAEKFIKLIKKFHLPNVKDSESFVEEFDFLLTRTDPRYFEYKPESLFAKSVKNIREVDSDIMFFEWPESADSLGSQINLDESVLNFDLFRKIFLERNL